MFIGNGRFGQDKFKGKVTSSGKSVIDYVILSEGILGKVSSFEVKEFDALFSDVHSKVNFSIISSCLVCATNKYKLQKETTHTTNTLDTNAAAKIPSR